MSDGKNGFEKTKHNFPYKWKLSDALQMLEQTKPYRDANNLTLGNVFLDTTIDKAKAVVNGTDGR